MSDSINIYPFTNTEGLIRFGVQVLVFLVGLYLAHKLIILPAMRLHAERKKRTIGNSEAAQKNTERANLLEHDYFTRLKEGAEESRRLREQQISAAQKMALSIVAQTQQKTSEYLKNVKSQLSAESDSAKSNLAHQLDEVVNTVYKKLGLLLAMLIVGTAVLCWPQSAYCSEQSAQVSFWYSIFWPYFQFLMFLLAAMYFGKKPLQQLLETRRDDFRAKLSEAHQAVYLADKRMKEYEAKMAALEGELKAIRDRNIEDAGLERERIVEEANRVSALLLKESERTAVELINSCKEEIKKELFELALMEVEKRLTHDKIKALDDKLKSEILTSIKSLH